MGKPLVIKIETKLLWMVAQQPSGALVAECEALGLVSEGSNRLDLWQNINESIQLVMNNLLRCGELDDFLRSHGWKSVPVPGDATDGPVPFEVPIELVHQEQARRDSARAAYQ